MRGMGCPVFGEIMIQVYFCRFNRNHPGDLVEYRHKYCQQLEVKGSYCDRLIEKPLDDCTGEDVEQCSDGDLPVDAMNFISMFPYCH